MAHHPNTIKEWSSALQEFCSMFASFILIQRSGRFTHILYGYFTDNGSIIRLHRNSETTLRRWAMGHMNPYRICRWPCTNLRMAGHQHTRCSLQNLPCHLHSSFTCVEALAHIEAETKWSPFSRGHFQMHFPEWKSLNFYFVPKVPIDNKQALAQIMAWRLTGDKPLSELMMAHFTDAYMRHSASMS